VAGLIDSGAPAQNAEHPYRWTMLAGVWLAYYSFGLTSIGLAPLVKPITDDLNMSHSSMGLVLGSWQLVFIASSMPLGALLDKIGIRRGLLLAGVVIALSSFLRATAVDFTTLALAVAVFGLGGPLVSIGAPKMISQWFAGKERGFAMGIYMVGPALGGITSLSLTNSLMMPLFDYQWRHVLMTYAGFTLLSALIWFAIASHPANRDLERAVAAQPSVGQTKVFGDLLRLRSVQLVLAMSVGIFFFNHGLNNWLPEILRSGGMELAQAGYWAAMPTAVGVAGSLLIPRLATTPARRFTILGFLFVCAGVAALLIHADGGPLLAFGLILQGIARSSMMTIAVLVLIEAKGVDIKHAGAAGGLFFSAAEIGGVLGPVTLGLVSDATGGFSAALSLLTGIPIVLLGLLWLLRRDQQA
jgi:CP family cyanate transporter-like MFS transporter